MRLRYRDWTNPRQDWRGMSDTMKIQPFDVLLNWILKEYKDNHSIFGIHESLFFRPGAAEATDEAGGRRPFAVRDMFGQPLGTPIGPAAGPHTQLAQNIVCAWLSGGRFIELKTVQIMDQLEIPRPCIDMEDEGYNVEWSQELRLHESIDEYAKAWALLRILPRVLEFNERAPFDTIFNMSVGYNLEGIQSAPMTRFMDHMADASEEIAGIQGILRNSFPQFADVEIPRRITNSVTLSTMHGCPPDEIERIARFMIEERGLHTTVKLNPTLLGKERVFAILHGALGFDEMQIPDSAFEHDLKYPRALELIRALKRSAAARGLTFGVKLSNTLAMRNHRKALPGQEMYMSGRALYPLTMNLFDKIAHEFQGDLNISYSAGADAINAVEILACGALPVTVASDLLKPGGYSRLAQYLENIESAMRERGARNLEELARDKLANVTRAAADALENPRFKKSYRPPEAPKAESGLGLFDCVVAPCVEKCPVKQDVPEYAWLIAKGDYDRALEVILARNPLPGVTGYICTHVCQLRCTRLNYEETVAIRALKRAAFERGRASWPQPPTGQRRKAAIIGAGPSGLSAAAFLALNGVHAVIFEAHDYAGGMMSLAPVFRLPHEVIQEDVDRIASLGVEIKYNHLVKSKPEDLLAQGFDAVYVASGFARNTPLNIEGIEAPGVYSALEILEKSRRGQQAPLGEKVLIIGGGNTAMDAARTAQRMSGQPSTIVYRRTAHEMPADLEEREDCVAEGNKIVELASPVRVIVKNGRAAALECVRNRLGDPGPDGRRKPIEIPGSHFQIEADAIIIAIGQIPDLTFLNGSKVNLKRDGAIAVDAATHQAGAKGIYAGGDAVRGPATIIQACADGRLAAEAICRELGVEPRELPFRPAALSEAEIAQVKRMRSRKEAQIKPAALPLNQRGGYDLVEQTYTRETARAEALRCLQCSTFCDKCVEVCPNRANLTFFVKPLNLTLPRIVCRSAKSPCELCAPAFGEVLPKELAIAGYDPFKISQTRQIMHIDDFCNECGNCETFCVHLGKPYREKPRLFLKEADFLRETDNAYFIQSPQFSIRGRFANREMKLSGTDNDQALTFENDNLCGQISLPEFHILSVELKQSFDGEFSLAKLAGMYAILQGVKNSMRYLPVEA